MNATHSNRLKSKLVCSCIAVAVFMLLSYVVFFKKDAMTIEFIQDNDGAGYDWTGFYYFIAIKTDGKTFHFVERYCYRNDYDFMDQGYLVRYKTNYRSLVPGTDGEFKHLPRTPDNFPSLFTHPLRVENTKIVLFYTNLTKNKRNTGEPDGVFDLGNWSCYEFTPQRHSVISTKMLFENADATLGKYAGCNAE